MKKIVTVLFLGGVLTAALCLSGCIIDIHDHQGGKPGSGPAGEVGGQKPQGGEPQKFQCGPAPRRILSARLESTGIKTGNLRFSLPDGEVCQGEYVLISWSERSSRFSQAQYREYCGAAPAAGMTCARIDTKGVNGTILRGEYFPFRQNPLRGYGLLQDDQGNLYPLRL